MNPFVLSTMGKGDATEELKRSLLGRVLRLNQKGTVQVEDERTDHTGITDSSSGGETKLAPMTGSSPIHHPHLAPFVEAQSPLSPLKASGIFTGFVIHGDHRRCAFSAMKPPPTIGRWAL